uniref:Lipase n=1 Tax=Ditylenchus dipsaci TaxID=166011 RepID=A0A915ER57_9BILA
MLSISTRILWSWTISLLVVATVRADLTPHFRKFLDERYGGEMSSKMERSGTYNLYGGSFGGKKSDNDTLTHQAVVFVHGTTLRASVFAAHKTFFMERGYSESELYATTYADGGQTPFFSKPMYCTDVKQIREFITAVYEYTNSTVDVVAYSMGVAISRKAILGGRCAETEDYLGRPITKYVDAFVAIAGVAYGLERCPQNMQACNNINGMACNSEFLRDVNSKTSSYEGNATYAIYSKDDFLVGQNCCDHPCSELKNANLTVIRQKFDHITVFTQTKEIQYALVNHSPVDI